MRCTYYFKNASSFVQGNLVLTDANYQILTLLRSHRDDAKGLATMAAHAYPIHAVRLRTPVTPDALAAALAAADEKATLRGDSALYFAVLIPSCVSLCFCVGSVQNRLLHSAICSKYAHACRSVCMQCMQT